MIKNILILASFLAFAGCNREKMEIQERQQASKHELQAEKHQVDVATSDAKKQAEADYKTEVARIEAQQQAARAQIEADKRKVDADAKADAKEITAQRRAQTARP